MSLNVIPILCNAGFMDNYAYLLTDEESKKSAIIDASEAAPIIKICEEYGVEPEYIFVTHHHDDHIGGNVELKEKYGLKIVAPLEERELIAGGDIWLADGDEFVLGSSVATIIQAKGHTNGHILWYFKNDKKLFTGDVLFNLSIGGLFEGTPEQMWQTLEKIKALPDDVQFYCGHEYTAHGLQNLPQNDEAKKYLEYVLPRLKQHLPTVGIDLGLEKKCNPYLRISSLQEFKHYF